jgi:hypothetical protein
VTVVVLFRAGAAGGGATGFALDGVPPGKWGIAVPLVLRCSAGMGGAVNLPVE